jgi:hypothetical protein
MRLPLVIACAVICAFSATATGAAAAGAGGVSAGLLASPLAAAGSTDTAVGSAGAAAGSTAKSAGSTATAAATGAAATTQPTNPEAPIPVPASNIPPTGRKLSANRVLKIASALAKMRAVRAEYPGSYGGAYLKGPFRWQVSFFAKGGKQEIGQVILDDSGRVLEQWTGFQVAWTMARGYPGAFGRHVNALYIWLPLCLLFFVPFFDWRRPLRLLHLDLLVLLSFSVSLAFFNHAHIYASVPLVYPPLLYLLARMLALLRRGRDDRDREPGQRPVEALSLAEGQPPVERPVEAKRPAEALHLLVPAPWLAIGVVFLIGFRVGLNVTDGNVIDVGYAGVIGAQRIVHGKSLYGGYPTDNEHGDTYGPVNYEAYVPFEQVFGWSGTWDDLPAAHAAAVVFDLLAVALLFLLGRRMRGPTLGIALAYAWVSYPFTLFALESDSNDALVAVLVLAALLCATYRAKRGPSGAHRAKGWVGAFAALAGLTKFAPLALAPLLATHGLRELAPARRPRAFALFLAAFLGVAALASIPALSHDSLHTIYERTIAYQANRASPFSVWGLYDGLGGFQRAAQLAAVALALALALAVIPRRPDLVGLAAACAAVLVAAQLGIEHWFYLYIPWFFPLAMVALLGRFSCPDGLRAGVASRSARSPRPAVFPHSGSPLP